MDQTLAPTVSTPATRDRTAWLALYTLCAGMLMIVLDATVVNVALPAIRTDLGFSSSGLAWVVNGYLIAFGGLLLLAGRLGDLLGRRRVFLAGLAVFTLASAACGAAPNGEVLVGARFVQGIGGALTSAVILGMIVTMFPDRRDQARAIGVYAFVASAGGAVGLLAGGVLTETAGWHWVFLVNVPIGIATILAATVLVPADGGSTSEQGSDVLGAVLVTAGLTAVVYAIVVPAAERGWTSGTTLAWGAGALTLLAAFVLREALTPAPLVPLRIFRSRTVVGANAIQTIGAAGMFGSFFLGSLYLHQVLGYRPLEIGLAFLPVTVVMGTLSVRYSERLVTRFGAPAVMVPGLLLVAAGLAGLALAPTDASLVANVLPPMLLLGAGAGLCFPALMTLAMTGVAPEDAGLASGLVNATGQVGGAVGLAVLATVSSSHAATLTARGVAPLDALTGGFHAAFWTASGLVLVALAVAVVLSRPDVPAADVGPEIGPAVQPVAGPEPCHRGTIAE